MHAEILSIGSEILLGEIVDTNSATIAQKLRSIGMPLRHIASVGDDLGLIVAAIRLGMARSDLLITTGGLGPTVDDLTRQAFALAVGQPLLPDPDALAQIEQRFRRWGRPMGENNRRQAYRPEGSIPIANPVGTAPCFIVEQDGHVGLCLPGVPKEMEYLLDHAVLPFLRQRFGLSGIVKSRALHIAGAGESAVDAQVGDLEELANPAVGLNAHPGIVTLRITATAASAAEADDLIAPVEATARERLGELVFGADAETLEAAVLAALARRGETLATVESGTGGRLAGKLAGQGGGAFLGGRVLAGMGGDTLELAHAAAAQAGADWGLACAMDIAADGMPLDMAVWHRQSAQQWRRGFGGHPALAPEWSANLALDALRGALAALNPSP